MAATTTLDITSPVIGENQINMVPAGANVTFAAANPGGEGVMYTFWVRGPGGNWKMAQESDKNVYTKTNLNYGTHVVDVYCWNAENPALAQARQVILVDSSVVFTEKSFKDGKITLTAQATNIAEPVDYQFWYKDSEGWQCAQDYSVSNTASFAATAGQTYEIAVYAKDNKAIRHWKQAAAASDTYQVAAGFARITASDVTMKEGIAGINFGVKVDFPAGVTNVKITKADGLSITPAKAITSGQYASVPGTYNAGNNEVEFIFDSDNGKTYKTTVKGATATEPVEVTGPVTPALQASDVTTKQGFAGINFGVKVDFPAGVTNVKITSVDGLAITPAKALTSGQYASVPGTYNPGGNVIGFSYDANGAANTATITK